MTKQTTMGTTQETCLWEKCLRERAEKETVMVSTVQRAQLVARHRSHKLQALT